MRVFQRTCSILGNRLRNFRIGVTNRNPRRVRPNVGNYQLCSHYGGAVGRGQLLNLNCRRALYGRYVIVQIVNRREYLTLCEVEVFGKSQLIYQYLKAQCLNILCIAIDIFINTIYYDCLTHYQLRHLGSNRRCFNRGRPSRPSRPSRRPGHGRYRGPSMYY